MTSSPRLLLCTDLDRTLLPNGAQPESPRARACFRALVAHEDVRFAYVTGRDLARVERAIVNYSLPRPDFVVSDVGTSIYTTRDGRWTPHEGWQHEIAPDWRGHSRQQLAALLADVGVLRPQEYSRQNTHKLSYYVPLQVDRAQIDAAIQTRLQAHGIGASRVWSIDEPAGIGLLDVLPLRATKLHAVQFICRDLQVPLERTLFAGDSGNDLALMASDIPSVLVANAQRTVAHEAVASAARNGNADTLYLARGGFIGMNGHYAAGILEGVAHFHPDLVPLFAAAAEAPEGTGAR